MKALAFAAVLVLAASAQAGVIVVSGNAAAVQAAIDGASNGDIVLIKPGSGGLDGELLVQGKSLTLDVDGGSYDLERLTLKALPVGGQIVVRGLTMKALDGELPSLGFEYGMIEVRDCAGAVWIDHCTIDTPYSLQGNMGNFHPGAKGLLVMNSANVVVSDCTITGGHGANETSTCSPGSYYEAKPGGPGVYVRTSKLALLNVSATGGVGGHDKPTCGDVSTAASGAGLYVIDACTVHASGCHFTGGPNDGLALKPGPGVFLFTTSSLTLRDCVVLAGSGLPSVPAFDGDGTLVTSATPARGLDVTSPIRVGQAGAITIDGLPGDLVALFEATTGAWLPLPAKEGVFLLGSPLVGPIFLAVNPVGAWNIPFTMPPLLPPGVLGQTVLLQLLAKSGPKVTLDDVTACTLLDASVP